MDERELIRQMKSGDRASFDQIYEKYYVPLFRSAYLICGNREDAKMFCRTHLSPAGFASGSCAKRGVFAAGSSGS